MIHDLRWIRKRHKTPHLQNKLEYSSENQCGDAQLCLFQLVELSLFLQELPGKGVYRLNTNNWTVPATVVLLQIALSTKYLVLTFFFVRFVKIIIINVILRSCVFNKFIAFRFQLTAYSQAHLVWPQGHGNAVLIRWCCGARGQRWHCQSQPHVLLCSLPSALLVSAT